LLSLVFWEI
jgi:hypothetical protein